jgi:hypothetical protein
MTNIQRLHMVALRHWLLGTKPDAKLMEICSRLSAMTDPVCADRWALEVLNQELGLFGETERHVLLQLCAAIDENNTYTVYANAGMDGDDMRYALTQGDHVGARYITHTGLKSSKVKDQSDE